MMNQSDIHMSYLPLAHMFERVVQVCEIYNFNNKLHYVCVCVCVCFSIYDCDPQWDL